ncbi:hypothetical protein AB6A40_010098 [Gnathostoma spinigerum]|uniref:Uncharacterized protein n=1 Tax=Gnathostoma spinigerum TaxID=75299 RepID=A0ABD6F0V4_9BILA
MGVTQLTNSLQLNTMSAVEERTAEKRRHDDKDQENGIASKESKLENGNVKEISGDANANQVLKEKKVIEEEPNEEDGEEGVGEEANESSGDEVDSVGDEEEEVGSEEEEDDSIGSEDVSTDGEGGEVDAEDGDGDEGGEEDE